LLERTARERPEAVLNAREREQLDLFVKAIDGTKDEEFARLLTSDAALKMLDGAGERELQQALQRVSDYDPRAVDRALEPLRRRLAPR
jgi:hypothetical protein